MSELLKKVRRVRVWIEKALEVGERGDLYSLLRDLELAQAELAAAREEMWGVILKVKRKNAYRKFLFVLCAVASLFATLLPTPLSHPPHLPVFSFVSCQQWGTGLEFKASGELAFFLSSVRGKEVLRAPLSSLLPVSGFAGAAASSGVKARGLDEGLAKGSDQASIGVKSWASYEFSMGPRLSERDVLRMVRLARRELLGGSIRILIDLEE